MKHNWHPFTQMKDHEDLPPVLIEKAKGIKLYDDKGNFYYDTTSSWWCNIHGHNHPKIVSAIKKQISRLDHVMFAGFTHKPAFELAEKLVAMAPKGISRVFYSDDGSTAVETALKMSFQYWKNKGIKTKEKFVCLDKGYHGDTAGSMSVSEADIFNKIFKPLFFKSFNVPSPYCYRCPLNKERRSCAIDCVKLLEELLKKRSKEISALIIEPIVLAAGGIIIYPPQYLKRAARLCKKYNVHLILDEVATGFGRTGRMFACEWAGVSPDFLCLSKGITSGTLPFAAALTTENIYRAFYDKYEKRKTFYHGHTYTANHIGCAAALSSLKIFKEEKTMANVKRVAPLLKKGLEKFKTFSFVGDVRCIGMIGAVEIVKDKKTKEMFAFDERVGYQIYKEGLKHNLVLRPIGNVIYLYLPLCTKEREL
ncbi:MAG: adenosylmethionine--8-amino-7-oxononanoate transaminase, partial [Candidatus Margulisiibacteriota bacterium]